MAIVLRDSLLRRFGRKVVPSGLKKALGKYRHRKLVEDLKKKGAYNSDFPGALNLSLSVLCQGRCIYCPNERGKGITPPFMPLELAKKIIDEAKEENLNGIFRFSENGEGLLNKEFLKIYEYCRKTLPLSKSILYTNMALLNKEIGLKLLTLGLDELHLNVDGASKITYESTKKLNFETLKKNLHDFIDTRQRMEKPCKIHIWILTAKKYFEKVEGINISLPDDTSKVIEYWEPFLKENDIFSIVDRPYRWAQRERVKTPKTNPCGKLSKIVRECLIGPNGDIYLCCLDYQQKCVIGNIADTSIKKIWNSDRRRNLLNLLEMGRFDIIGDPCKFCLD